MSKVICPYCKAINPGTRSFCHNCQNSFCEKLTTFVNAECVPDTSYYTLKIQGLEQKLKIAKELLTQACGCQGDYEYCDYCQFLKEIDK